MAAAFATDITSVVGEHALVIDGPTRAPVQMLAEQTYGGHTSVHDGETADKLGLSGAPIEGPTHFSQFDPLAHHLFGDAWFETGCISAHFKTMVVEGEEVTASVLRTVDQPASIEATKKDGSLVLTGTISIDRSETELDARRTRLGDPGELFIMDQLSVGDRSPKPTTVSIDADSPNGDLYPFSLNQKLDGITEPSPWYASADNPWGRPIVPFEMLSVLAHKVDAGFPVRGPSVGLFLDLEVRLVAGPVFVGHDYVIEHEIVGLGQSRRTESNWMLTTVTDAASGDHVADVLLHAGVFKESYDAYPADRL